MSAQVLADRQRGGKARVLVERQQWVGHTGWGLGVQAPTSALLLTAWSCGPRQTPYPLWVAVSHLYCEAIRQHSLCASEDMAFEPHLSLEGSWYCEVSPGGPELNLPFDNRLRVQADTQSPGICLEAEPQVVERAEASLTAGLAKGRVSPQPRDLRMSLP